MASQTQLKEAEDALHALMIGKKAVKVMQNGRSVEYAPADIDKLRAYIDSLKNQLQSATRARRAPARFY